MTMSVGSRSPWKEVPLSLRAILVGLLIALVAANVWPLLLLRLGVPLGAPAEVLFLALYMGWAGGGGSPQSTRSSRADSFRSRTLSRGQWIWGLTAAVFFAVTVHASIVFLFRLVPYPVAAFRQGYDFSFIPTVPLRWIAVVVSAASAGICEETGFRGYMQRPIEERHGAAVAILVSSVFFTAIHLTKGWALIGMVPIILGAGLLLGFLARAANSLIPGIIGHTIMDIGLFAYWWTGIAGTFPGRPISETGVDRAFAITCVVLVVSLAIVLFSIRKIPRSRLWPAS